MTAWGLLALWAAGKRQTALLLLTAGASYGLLVLLTMVESRLKTPVIVWMIPAAAYAIDRAFMLLRAGLTREHLRRGALLVAVSALAYLFIYRGATELPRAVTVVEMPTMRAPLD